MERGRSFGSYFLFLVREGLFRLRSELWGWRGVVVLLIGAYLVVDLFASTESGSAVIGQGIAVIWMVVLFQPRLGSLLYLLPFSQKERSRYLRTYLFTYLFFQVFVFSVGGGLGCLITKYSYLEWIKIFAFGSCPFLLFYSGVMLYTVAARKEAKNVFSWLTPFYSTRGWKEETDNVAGIHEDCKGAVKLQKKKWKELTEAERNIRKKEVWLNTVTLVNVFVLCLQGYFCPAFFSDKWV